MLNYLGVDDSCSWILVQRYLQRKTWWKGILRFKFERFIRCNYSMGMYDEWGNEGRFLLIYFCTSKPSQKKLFHQQKCKNSNATSLCIWNLKSVSVFRLFNALTVHLRPASSSNWEARNSILQLNKLENGFAQLRGLLLFEQGWVLEW